MSGIDPDDDPLLSLFVPGAEGSIIQPQADSLWDKVDFRLLLSVFFRTYVLGFITFIVGIFLAFRDASLGLLESLRSLIADPLIAVASFPAAIQEATIPVAEESVVDFGLFALPASVVVVLAAFLGISIVVWLFLGGD